jgi:mono/diheme cytochrome c family protein
LIWWLFAEPAVGSAELPDTAAAIERGRYLATAGGCVICHEGTEHPGSLSGGLALESDFGTFRVPNITPDEETGIGGWTATDFLRALKHGRSPGGGFYYPAFPYLAYEGMTDPLVARGAYLARHLGHCGECHTPRNRLGIPDLRREFAGGVLPEGKVEAIDAESLGDWSEQAFALFLSLGLKPDGEFVGGEMEPVIEHNTSRLTAEDQKALAAFFLRQRRP